MKNLIMRNSITIITSIVNLLIVFYLITSKTTVIICDILHINEWFATFLLTILFVFILPVIFSFTSKFINAIILNFNSWFILFAFIVLHKTLIIPLQDNLILYCILCAYISTCGSIGYTVYIDKQLTFFNIICWFLQTIIIIACIKLFVMQPLAELLPSLYICLQLCFDNKLPLFGASIVHLSDNTTDPTGYQGLGGNTNSSSNQGSGGSTDNQPRQPLNGSGVTSGGVVWTKQEWDDLTDRMEAAARIISTRERGGVVVKEVLDFMGANQHEIHIVKCFYEHQYDVSVRQSMNSRIFYGARSNIALEMRTEYPSRFLK